MGRDGRVMRAVGARGARGARGACAAFVAHCRRLLWGAWVGVWGVRRREEFRKE